MYPQILYWKWNDDILKEGELERKAQDIFNRSIFDTIYVSLHSSEHSASYPEIKAKIKKFSEILNERGKKLVMDLDMRREHEKCKSYGYLNCERMAQHTEAVLDENGSAVFVPGDDRFEETEVLGAWCFKTTDDSHFILESLEDIKEKVQRNGSSYSVHLGSEKSGYTAICYLAHYIDKPDYFYKDFSDCWDRFLSEFSDIKLGGVGVDEFGIGHCIKNDDGVLKTYCFHISEGLCKKYELKTGGRNLKNDLLYFRYSPCNDDSISIDIVSTYTDIIRETTSAIEERFYNCVKKYFGDEALVMCHPTLWGDEYNANFDTLHNGFNWWNVKRDYAQTDELIAIPIRTAMSRMCKENVWYNMWYSMRTLDIKTYYRESWINARFGGRTHYLGYECYEPGVVLVLKENNYLESVSETEEVMKKLNEVHNAKPDARVLVLFSMGFACNWMLTDRGEKYWRRDGCGIPKIFRFIKDLFGNEFLIDAVPSSEIDTGRLVLDGNGAQYGDQSYDAVILYMPEGVSEKVVKSCVEYASNGLLLTVGEITYTSEGKDAKALFDSLVSCSAFTTEENETAYIRCAEFLDKNKISRNMGKYWCKFTDGSIIFTSDGEKNLGNLLIIDEYIDSRHIEFKGEDFLYIREIQKGEFVYSSGKASMLRIDGKIII